MAAKYKAAKAWDKVREQRKWIEEHGGNLSGYIARYGSKYDSSHYGDGGEDIYAADLAYLRELEEYLESVGG